MDYTKLILAVLGAFSEYGPTLVKSVTDLIHGNPQQPGERDAAYVARIDAEIDAKAADTTAADQSVIQEEIPPKPADATPPPPTPPTVTPPPAANTGGILNVK